MLYMIGLKCVVVGVANYRLRPLNFISNCVEARKSGFNLCQHWLNLLFLSLRLLLSLELM